MLEEASTQPPKRSKADNHVSPKLIDASSRGIPSDLSTFHDVELAGRLARVNILSHDYDKCMELAPLAQRDMFTGFR